MSAQPAVGSRQSAEPDRPPAPARRLSRFWLGSLRARLALWQAGLLAVTLILLSGLTLVILRNVLTAGADSSLRDYAEKTASMIATALYQASVPGREKPTRFLREDNKEWGGRQLQIVNAHTGVVTERTLGLKITLPIDLETRVRASRGETTFQTLYDLDEYPVRMVTVPVQMGREVPYIVQAASSSQGVEEALRRTSMILLVLTPLVFAFSLLGGWLLVGRSLKPVGDMTRTAMAMEPGKLDHRIEPVGSDDEIARLASAFNEMIGRLDRSFRQIQQFSADASHELKTPLTSIRGEAEVALMGELEPEQYRKTLRSIIDDVERMSAIVENLLLLARADADQVHIKREPLALEDVLLRVYEQMEAIARRKGVALELGDMESAEVMGDPLWLGQIVTNLVNNAVKYTPAGGTVTLGLRVERSEQVSVIGDQSPEAAQIQNPKSKIQNRPVLLSVSDTGPGIPAEHLPRLFDRFYRVDSGRSRDAGGVGLGLNIAQWAAHSHEGEITVESEVGKGTTFTLVLQMTASHTESASE